MRKLKLNLGVTGNAGKQKSHRQKQKIAGAVLVLAMAWAFSGVTFSPSALEFGSLPVGIGTELKSVTITNRTSSEYRPVVHLEGASASDFHVFNGACETLASGARCNLPTEFRPQEPGIKHATLRVGTDTAGGDEFAIDLTGTALAAALTIAPGILDFGDTVLNKESRNEVKLKGEGWFHIHGVELINDPQRQFSMNAQPCETNTIGMKQCVITVLFAPTSVGAAEAKLIIKDDALQAPHSVKLRGKGINPYTPPRPVTYPPPAAVANSTTHPATTTTVITTPITVIAPAPQPAIRVEPAVLDFAAQPNQVQQVHVRNEGKAPLHITQVNLQGSDSDRFERIPTGCANGQEIPGGGECLITVRYKTKWWRPKASYNALLEITHDDPNFVSPQNIALRWEREKTPQISLEHQLKFSTVAGEKAPSQTVTIRNVGEVPIGRLGLRLEGTNRGAFHQTSNCVELAPSQECTVQVSFFGLKPASYQGNLIVFDESSLRDLGVVELVAVASAPPTVE